MSVFLKLMKIFQIQIKTKQQQQKLLTQTSVLKSEVNDGNNQCCYSRALLAIETPVLLWVGFRSYPHCQVYRMVIHSIL